MWIEIVYRFGTYSTDDDFKFLMISKKMVGIAKSIINSQLIYSKISALISDYHL